MALFDALFQKDKKPSDPWDNTLLALRSLDVMRYEGFLRPNYSLVKLPVMYSNLNEYIKAMKLYVEKESLNQVIPSQLYNRTPFIIHLQDLFLDENGYSLPIVETFRELQNSGESFCYSLSSGGHEVSSRNRDLAGRFIHHFDTFITFIQESEYMLD